MGDRIKESTIFIIFGHRDWECDTMMPSNSPPEAKDIAKQLIESERGQKLNVVLGGGRAAFTPDKHSSDDKWQCSRSDGQDLVTAWEQLHPRGQFVATKSELFQANVNETENILGISQIE